MGSFVIKGRSTFLGELDMGRYSHAVAIDYGADEVEDTVMTDETHIMGGGITTFGFSMDAYANYADLSADARPEEISFANVGSEVPLSLPSVAGAEGEICFLITARQLMSAPLAGNVGARAGWNVQGRSAAPLVRGLLEVNRSAAGSSFNTTGANTLGAVSATQKVYANLHVMDASGTTPTLDVVVQSDDNSGFSSATNRLTFTQATGPTAEALELAGAITDTYWRASVTIGGSSPEFRFALSIGIE